MIKKIKELEAASKLLEPNAGEREQLRDAVVNYTENFIETIGEQKARYVTEHNGAGLYNYPIQETGIDLDKVLDIYQENLDEVGSNCPSPGYLAYIPGGSIYHSALGDFWAGISNRYSAVFHSGPGAVRMENMLIDWMKDLFKYPKAAVGNLTSGGSIANLLAVLAARDNAKLSGETLNKAVVYFSGQAHHCLDKALRIACLGEVNYRFVPLDDHYRMRVDALEDMIQEDKAAGLEPWLLVGQIGTTDTGAVDPINKLADVAEANKMWFHIDAAYGGFFTLTEEAQKHFAGVERSDSIVLDPHKGLFLPFGTGVVLVKDKSALDKSCSSKANYMQDTKDLAEELSPAELSPELSRPFRALRMWLPLQILGLAPFRAALSEKLLLTKYFYQEIQKQDHIVVGPEPDLSVAIFRYEPDPQLGIDANEFNKQLVKLIEEDGRIFLSSTNIDGQYWIRFVALCFRSHLDIVDTALQIITEKSKILLDNQQKAAV